MTGGHSIACSGKVRVAADADTVWGLIGDLRSMAIMEGVVERLEVDGDGEGAIRRLFLPGGAVVTEAIVRYNRAARSYTYRIIARGPLPFDNYVGTASVTPDGDACVLTWEARADPLIEPADVRAAIQANIDHVLRVVSARFAPGA
ncbi:SRPBCC family protein [Sphingosinicella soli]|uniref:Carbon monoxide dehydrogenase subunit G n=1 Tax=Sphingosinicella soli TaxID=333708 RepID=A0A7W7B2Y9_9SPHN|nr:SRPBCC family protein [Sphingosinicella soli]MBB4633028.1 carbon monoxide dehydrogenase subunit G [Sphingosinicella soli]